MGGSRLRVVRSSEPPPPLELPRADVRTPWWNSAATGWAITVSLLGGAVLVAMAMGWVHG